MLQALSQWMDEAFTSQLSQEVLTEIEAKVQHARQCHQEKGLAFDEATYRKSCLKNEHLCQSKKTANHPNWMETLKKLHEKNPENFLRQNNIKMNDALILSNIAPKRADMRVIPNDFARSSLFFVKKKGTPRKTMNREKLFHLSDKVEVRYTGEELRDDDELVWLSLVHYCYNAPLGEAVDVKVLDLLKDLGWKPTGENYQRIRTIISRLKATDVIIKNKATYGDLEAYQKRKKAAASLTRGISMIGEYLEYDKIDGQATRYLISIDKMLIFFFAGGLFTYLNWTDYKKPTPTGRRLTDYALSHKEPEALSVERFLLTCGTDAHNTPVKTQNLLARRACAELVKKGIVSSAQVKDGYILIERESATILPDETNEEANKTSLFLKQKAA